MVAPASEDKRGIKRKAGGSGKKGKTFLENKSDLLSLVSGITDTKDAVAKAKVDKVKRSDVEVSSGGKDQQGSKGKSELKGSRGVEKKKSSAGEIKRAEKEKALEEAKEAILAKRRAKKARKVERETGDMIYKERGATMAPKKKVGFA